MRSRVKHHVRIGAGLVASLKGGVSVVLTLVMVFVLVYTLIRVSPKYGGEEGLWDGAIALLRGLVAQDTLTPVPVWKILVDAGLKSIVLTGGGLLILVAFAVPAGVVAGLFRKNAAIHAGVWVCSSLSNVPVFITAILAVQFMGMLGYTVNFGSWHVMSSLERFLAVILPSALLGLGNGAAADVIRQTMNETELISRQRYLLSSMANGYSKVPHFLKNGVVPVLGILNRKTAFLLGGGIVVERLFGIGGLGNSILSMMEARLSGMGDFSRLAMTVILYALIVKLVDGLARSLSIAADYRLRPSTGRG